MTAALQEKNLTDSGKDIGENGFPEKTRNEYMTDVLLSPEFETGGDVIWERNSDHILQTNVKHTHIYHSPDGFEVGYGGSGPADFALNILAVVFPGNSTTELSDRAFELHQDFKNRFFVSAKDKGRITWDEIQNWIFETELDEEELPFLTVGYDDFA